MTSTEYSQKTNTQYGVVRNRSVSGNQIENSFLYKGDSNIDETSDIFQVLIKENKSSLVDSIPLLQDRPGAVHSDNNLKIQFKNQKEKLTIFMGKSKYWQIGAIAVECLGWRCTTQESEDWDLMWVDHSVPSSLFHRLKIYQKINHFPGMYEISRKNCLSENLQRIGAYNPGEYSFLPRTYLLPGDAHRLKKQFRKGKGDLYIAKPNASSQGKGIFITDNYKDLEEKQNYIVQKYISDPMLIDGHKFDMRIYVLITCCNPLKLYIYKEGLARFACEPYKLFSNSPTSTTNFEDGSNKATIKNEFMHLTNYSINKKHKMFYGDKSKGGKGSNDSKGHGPKTPKTPKTPQRSNSRASSSIFKRSLSNLFEYLEDCGINTTKIWDGVKDIAVKTLLAIQPNLIHYYKLSHPEDKKHGMCFEVLGFDILLDHKMKLWLLEVNHAPSFNMDTVVDKYVKSKLIRDTFTLLDMSYYRKLKIIKRMKEHQKTRINFFKTENKSLEQFVREVDLAGGESIPYLLGHSGASQEQGSMYVKLGEYEQIYPCQSFTYSELESNIQLIWQNIHILHRNPNYLSGAGKGSNSRIADQLLTHDQKRLFPLAPGMQHILQAAHRAGKEEGEESPKTRKRIIRKPKYSMSYHGQRERERESSGGSQTNSRRPKERERNPCPLESGDYGGVRKSSHRGDHREYLQSAQSKTRNTNPQNTQNTQTQSVQASTNGTGLLTTALKSRPLVPNSVIASLSVSKNGEHKYKKTEYSSSITQLPFHLHKQSQSQSERKKRESMDIEGSGEKMPHRGSAGRRKSRGRGTPGRQFTRSHSESETERGGGGGHWGKDSQPHPLLSQVLQGGDHVVDMLLKDSRQLTPHLNSTSITNNYPQQQHSKPKTPQPPSNTNLNNSIRKINGNIKSVRVSEHNSIRCNLDFQDEQKLSKALRPPSNSGVNHRLLPLSQNKTGNMENMKVINRHQLYVPRGSRNHPLYSIHTGKRGVSTLGASICKIIDEEGDNIKKKESIVFHCKRRENIEYLRRDSLTFDYSEDNHSPSLKYRLKPSKTVQEGGNMGNMGSMGRGHAHKSTKSKIGRTSPIPASLQHSIATREVAALAHHVDGIKVNSRLFRENNRSKGRNHMRNGTYGGGSSIVPSNPQTNKTSIDVTTATSHVHSQLHTHVPNPGLKKEERQSIGNSNGPTILGNGGPVIGGKYHKVTLRQKMIIKTLSRIRGQNKNWAQTISILDPDAKKQIIC